MARLVILALLSGATVEQVAAACELTYEELRHAVLSWAAADTRAGRMSTKQWTVLTELLVGWADESRTDGVIRRQRGG